MSSNYCRLCFGTKKIIVRNTNNMNLKIGKLSNCPFCSYDFEECEDNCNGCYSCDGPGCETCGDNKIVDRIYKGDKYTGMVETPCPDCICKICYGLGHISDYKKCIHWNKINHFRNDINFIGVESIDCNMCKDSKVIYASNNDNKTANLSTCACSKPHDCNICKNCFNTTRENVKFENKTVTVSCKNCVCQTCLDQTVICNVDRDKCVLCPSCSRQ